MSSMESKGSSKITLGLLRENVKSWTFEVFVVDKGGEYKFIIELDKEHYKELTEGKVPPLVLVQESMFFLLDRESALAILKEFNIKEIKDYFKNYENEIKKSFLK